MRIVLLFLGLLTVVGAAWAVPREYSAAIIFRSESADLVSEFNEGYDPSRKPPLSLRAIREASSSCMNVSANLFYMLQPGEIQDGIKANCADFAQRMADTSPLAAYPYTALSIVAATPKDRIQALERSYALSKHEGWQAKVRFIQAVQPEIAANDIAAKDVLTLLGSYELLSWLAEYYLQNPDLRPTIVALVETAPNDQQRRFLGQVKNQSSATN